MFRSFIPWNSVQGAAARLHVAQPGGATARPHVAQPGGAAARPHVVQPGGAAASVSDSLAQIRKDYYNCSNIIFIIWT